MLFPTAEFATFFVIVATIFWALKGHWARQKMFLLVASYFFYGWWNWHYIALMLVSTLIDFYAGAGIGRSNTQAGRKRWLIFSVVANLGLLGFFKYYNFFQANMADIAGFLGRPVPFPALEILLPVGISFFTFQSMAYTLDVYRGNTAPCENLSDFMLFVAFFPQLVAGPICRSRELLPQISGAGPVAIPDLHRAVVLIGVGLLKKALIATFLATHFVDHVFVSPENYSALELLIAAYGYTAVVYCDFSGYTDLARGTSLLLGFELPENFRGPYASTNIGEFWRRWHVTFSQWLRDYVYFPLGGSRVSPLRTALNLMLTFLVGGLWHGADWKFVIWGAIHGVALGVYKVSLDWRRARGIDLRAPKPWWYLLGGWFLTLHVCVLARVFFRSDNLEMALRFFRGLGELTFVGHGVESAVLVAAAIGIGLSFFEKRMVDSATAALQKTPTRALPLVWAVLAVGIVKFRPTDVAPYIYFQF